MRLLLCFILVISSFSLANCFEGVIVLEETTQSPSDNFKRIKKILEEDDDSLAFYKIGSHYLKGDILSLDHEQALCFLTASANLGNIDAMKSLAKIYEEGNGRDKDIVKAFHWYLKSSELGDEYASNHLINLIKDIQIKNTILEIARKTKESEAQLLAGFVFEVLGDYSESIKWYTLAADQGNSEAFGDLGELYELGLAGDQNIDKAIELYKLGVSKGNIKSMLNLAFLYLEEEDVNQHIEAKNLFFEILQLQNNADAKYGLAILYEEGRGVPVDTIQSRQLLLEAAKGGAFDAQYYLAELYRNENNLKDALFWYKNSCEKGYKESCDLLKDLEW